MKTILLHIQNEDDLKARIEHGLSLARAASAHLSCLRVTPVEAYVAFDSFGGVFVMSEVMDALDQQEKNVRARAEAELKNEDVSWDFTQVTGNVVTRLAGAGALADLIITSREMDKGKPSGESLGMIGDLLYRARTPLFVPGTAAEPCDAKGTAVIAWDGSFEAANTVRSSIGLLRLATSVRVARVEEQKDDGFPETRLLEFLSRHGIHAKQTLLAPEGDDIAATILAHAQSLDASYVVMGGYSHSRLGEYFYGSVTRRLLSDSPVGIVIGR